MSFSNKYLITYLLEILRHSSERMEMSLGDSPKVGPRMEADC
jgi:hypothetical protein